MYEYKRAAFGLGQGAPVYAESSIESGIPGVVEARQITPAGPKGPLIPVDTDFARPIGHRGHLVPYATEYARHIGRHGPKGPLIPLGTEGVGGLFDGMTAEECRAATCPPGRVRYSMTTSYIGSQGGSSPENSQMRARDCKFLCGDGIVGTNVYCCLPASQAQTAPLRVAPRQAAARDAIQQIQATQGTQAARMQRDALLGARAEIRELRQTINNLIDRVRSGSAGARQDLQEALQHHDVTDVAMPQRLVAIGVPHVDWQGLQETLTLGRAVAAGEDIASSGNGSRQPVLNRGWLIGIAGGALALGVLVTLWVKRGQ